MLLVALCLFVASVTSIATGCCITEVFSWGGKKKSKFVLTLSDFTGTPPALRGPCSHRTLNPRATHNTTELKRQHPSSQTRLTIFLHKCHFFHSFTFTSKFTACLFYVGDHEYTAVSINPNTHAQAPFFIQGLYIIDHIFHPGDDGLQTMMVDETIYVLRVPFILILWSGDKTSGAALPWQKKT